MGKDLKGKELGRGLSQRADGRYMGRAQVYTLFITLELMIGGAMIFNYDFHGADLIALLFAFMVLYSGVVAVLTDK